MQDAVGTPRPDVCYVSGPQRALNAHELALSVLFVLIILLEDEYVSCLCVASPWPRLQE